MAKREETISIDKADLVAFGGKVRLDRFLSQKFPELSRSRIHELIDSGGVIIKDKLAKPSQSLRGGETIVVHLEQLASREMTLEPKPLENPLEILFEDDHIIVVNKPAGVTVHPGAGTQGEITLVHALLHHCGVLPEPIQIREDDSENEVFLDSSASSASLRPGIVHRLDRDTSGAIVIAKSAVAHRDLSAQFHDKTNFRQYLVLCSGPMPVDAVMRESWLGRDPGHRTRFRSFEEEGAGRKYAKTIFRREVAFESGATLVSARLYTGRTHQIRVHARDLGMPVAGDASYGDDSRLLPEIRILATRQMLHAWKLGFRHPVSGHEMAFEAPLPPDFANLLTCLSQNTKT